MRLLTMTRVERVFHEAVNLPIAGLWKVWLFHQLNNLSYRELLVVGLFWLQYSNNSKVSGMVLDEPSCPSRGKTFCVSDTCFSSGELSVNYLKWLKCTFGFYLIKQQPLVTSDRFPWALSLCMLWPLLWVVSCNMMQVLWSAPVITQGLPKAGLKIAGEIPPVCLKNTFLSVSIRFAVFWI